VGMLRCPVLVVGWAGEELAGRESRCAGVLEGIEWGRGCGG